MHTAKPAGNSGAGRQRTGVDVMLQKLRLYEPIDRLRANGGGVGGEPIDNLRASRK